MPKVDIARPRTLGARKPSAVSPQADGGGPGSLFPLKETTLLYLGRERPEMPPYRIWSEDLGGLALRVDGQYGLIAWLERNIATKAFVVIDDDRFDGPSACELAVEIRLMRPDVPVIVATDDEDVRVPDRDDTHSFAVAERPVTPSGLHRAIAVARLMVSFDRQREPRRVAPSLAGVDLHADRDSFDDYMGKYTGWWILPVVLLGAVMWLLLGYALVAGVLESARDMAVLPSAP